MGCFTRVTCGSQCPGCTGREDIPRICTVLGALYHKRARLNIDVTRFIMTQSLPPSKTLRLLTLVVLRPIRSVTGTSAPPQLDRLYSAFQRPVPPYPTTTCLFLCHYHIPSWTREASRTQPRIPTITTTLPMFRHQYARLSTA